MTLKSLLVFEDASRVCIIDWSLSPSASFNYRGSSSGSWDLHLFCACRFQLALARTEGSTQTLPQMVLPSPSAPFPVSRSETLVAGSRGFRCELFGTVNCSEPSTFSDFPLSMTFHCCVEGADQGLARGCWCGSSVISCVAKHPGRFFPAFGFWADLNLPMDFAPLPKGR